jgi:hypothetical protein
MISPEVTMITNINLISVAIMLACVAAPLIVAAMAAPAVAGAQRRHRDHAAAL